MSRTLACCIALIVVAAPLMAQTAAPDTNTPVSALQNTPVPTVRIDSRAVLVDVVVTDKNGKPVTGLKQVAFMVTEQGARLRPRNCRSFRRTFSATSLPIRSRLR